MALNTLLQQKAGRGEFVNFTPVIFESREGKFDDMASILSAGGFETRHRIRSFNMISGIIPTQSLGMLDENTDIVQKTYFDDAVPVPTDNIPEEQRVLSLSRPGLIPGLSFSPLRTVGIRPRDALMGAKFLVSKRSRRAPSSPNWIPTGKVRELVGANIARAEGIEGSGITTAVIDTGIPLKIVRSRHPQFGPNFTSINIDKFPRPERSGHGSHVSTTIAGKKWITPSGLIVEGIAPSSNIIAIKALKTRLGVGRQSDILLGFEIAMDNGANIINMSLGSDTYVFDSPFEEPLKKVIDAGIIPVVAAGNAGPDPSTVGTPGGSPNAITIGSITTQQNSSDFSSRGPVGNNIKPDVVSYGGNGDPEEMIYSGTAPGSTLDKLDKVVADGLSPSAGTSMATPAASATIALIWEWLRVNKGEELDFLKVSKMIKNSGAQKNNDTGYGLLHYSWKSVL